MTPNPPKAFAGYGYSRVALPGPFKTVEYYYFTGNRNRWPSMGLQERSAFTGPFVKPVPAVTTEMRFNSVHVLNDGREIRGDTKVQPMWEADVEVVHAESRRPHCWLKKLIFKRTYDFEGVDYEEGGFDARAWVSLNRFLHYVGEAVRHCFVDPILVAAKTERYCAKAFFETAANLASKELLAAGWTEEVRGPVQHPPHGLHVWFKELES
jgi:hypothetical protein